jgi:hypothetical protein
MQKTELQLAPDPAFVLEDVEEVMTSYPDLQPEQLAARSDEAQVALSSLHPVMQRRIKDRREFTAYWPHQTDLATTGLSRDTERLKAAQAKLMQGEDNTRKMILEKRPDHTLKLTLEGRIWLAGEVARVKTLAPDS